MFAIRCETRGSAVAERLHNSFCSLGVTQGHWKWYHSKAWVRFPIHSNYGHIFNHSDTIRTSFSVSGPSLWNSLPLSVRDPSLTMTQFCTHLKTFLFRRAYCTQHSAFVTVQAVNSCMDINLLTYLLYLLIHKSDRHPGRQEPCYAALLSCSRVAKMVINCAISNVSFIYTAKFYNINPTRLLLNHTVAVSNQWHVQMSKLCTAISPASMAQQLRQSLAAVCLACVAARLQWSGFTLQAPADCRYMQVN